VIKFASKAPRLIITCQGLIARSTAAINPTFLLTSFEPSSHIATTAIVPNIAFGSLTTNLLRPKIPTEGMVK